MYIIYYVNGITASQYYKSLANFEEYDLPNNNKILEVFIAKYVGTLLRSIDMVIKF